MEFYEVIEKRRSIRQFQEKEIAWEILVRILNAGLKAPSSNHQRQCYAAENAETPRQVSATVENKVHWNKW